MTDTPVAIKDLLELHAYLAEAQAHLEHLHRKIECNGTLCGFDLLASIKSAIGRFGEHKAEVAQKIEAMVR